MRKLVSYILVCAFVLTNLGSELLQIRQVYASEQALLYPVGDQFELPSIRGLKIDPQNIFNLDFILDKGDFKDVSQKQQTKMIRYFLAALTIPEDKFWVNLSPNESTRVIDSSVATSEIGQTLLEQDYLLKQLSSMLTHPDTKLGKKYWSSLNATQNKTMGKIWISLDSISIYDKNNKAYITDIAYKVESETDSNSINKVLLPELKSEVETGRNFSELRQMTYSIILAQWFKAKFMDSLFAFYFDANKMQGLDVVSPELKNQVFKKYVQAFESGAYNVALK